jgi:hypothetical protein
LSFINPKVNIQRGFSVYPSCEYALVSSTPSVTLPYPFLPIPYYFLPAFSTHHYVFYLHRCEVFWYCWLSFSFPFPPPLGLRNFWRIPMHTHVYCSAIHNSQVMQTTKMPHYWWMDQENVVLVH